MRDARDSNGRPTNGEAGSGRISAPKTIDDMLEDLRRRSQKRSSRDYERLLKASTVTPENRARAHANAAASRRIDKALNDADAAHERHLKDTESRGVQHRSAPRRSPRA